MFCARCGQQIPDGSETCPLCGRASTIQFQPQPAPLAAPASASAQPATPAFAATRPDLRGIRGWLLVFCIVVTILTPLGNLWSMQLNFPHPWSLYYLVIVVFSLVVGISVWQVGSQALTLVKAYFISFAAWEVFRIVYVLITTPQTGLDLRMIFRVRTLVWVAVWAPYFHKSERVRATFGRNL